MYEARIVAAGVMAAGVMAVGVMAVGWQGIGAESSHCSLYLKDLRNSSNFLSFGLLRILGGGGSQNLGTGQVDSR